MKHNILLLLLFQVLSTHAQFLQMRAHVSETFKCDVDESLFVRIFNNDIEIYQELPNEDGIESDCINQIPLFSNTYFIRKDTIFCKGKPIFNYFSEYILVLHTSLNTKLKKGLKFYCISKRGINGKVQFFGHWKNGKREGKWVIFNNVNKAKGYIYSKGKIVGTFVPDPAYNRIM